MRKLMMVLAVTAAAALTGCTGSNPIQRELGQASHLELTNRTSQNLQFELVAGTTPSELRQDDIVSTVTLAPGEAVKLPAYPGRYTLFPHQIDKVGIRTLAFSGVKLAANAKQAVTVGEEDYRTIQGAARRMVFTAS